LVARDSDDLVMSANKFDVFMKKKETKTDADLLKHVSVLE